MNMAPFDIRRSDPAERGQGKRRTLKLVEPGLSRPRCHPRFKYEEKRPTRQELIHRRGGWAFLDQEAPAGKRGQSFSIPVHV